MFANGFVVFSIFIVPAFLVFFFYNDYIKFLIKSKNSYLEKVSKKLKEKKDSYFIETGISQLSKKQEHFIYQIIFEHDFLYIENLYRNTKDNNVYLFLSTIEENISKEEITIFLKKIQENQVKIVLPDVFIEKNGLTKNKALYKKIIYKHSDILF